MASIRRANCDGAELFERLRKVAVRHDKRLRSHFTDGELKQFGEYLNRVRPGVGDPEPATAARA